MAAKLSPRDSGQVVSWRTPGQAPKFSPKDSGQVVSWRIRRPENWIFDLAFFFFLKCRAPALVMFVVEEPRGNHVEKSVDLMFRSLLTGPDAESSCRSRHDRRDHSKLMFFWACRWCYNTMVGAPEEISRSCERIVGEQCLAMQKLCCCGFLEAIYPWFCKASQGIHCVHRMHILQWNGVQNPAEGDQFHIVSLRCCWDLTKTWSPTHTHTGAWES